MEEYKRICEVCGKELFYKSYPAFWLAEKNNALCKSCAGKKKNNKKCDLSVLLDESPESYYWVGFLMADGHFSNGRISFILSHKDKEQILKFAEFIKWKGKIRETSKNVGICPMNKDIVNELCKKFDLNENKTYNPPKTILNNNEELIKYLIIGFIDGDGNISKQYKRQDCLIRIKIHKSWEKILKEFCKVIHYNAERVKINKDGYCELCISDSEIVTFLKKKANEVPVLKRKWEKINENYISRYTKSKILKTSVTEMLNKGIRNKDISKALKVSPSVVSKIKKEIYEK
jgi:hypothetical protein